MKISEHIKSLLFEHECVIIPNFGGFVGKYQEAKVDFKTSKLSPPVKLIAFNEKLQENDGLLINHIAIAENISYSDAEAKIKDYLIKLRAVLAQGKKVKLPEIGSFSMQKSALVFEPENSINFHADAYGLESFDFPMLSNLKKPTPQRKKQLEPVKSKKRRTNLVPLLVGLPLIAALSYVPIYFQNNSVVNQNETAGISIPVKLKNEANETASLTLKKKVLEEKSEPVIEANAKIQETIETPAQTKVAVSGNVYVIAGSFASYSNAEKAVNDYKNQGYNATILSASQGMNRVAVKSFSSTNAAYAELGNLKSALGNDELWILQN